MTYLSLALLVPLPLILGASAAALRRRGSYLLAALAMLSVFTGMAVTTADVVLPIAGADLSLTQIARLELGFLAIIGLALLVFHFLSDRSAPLPILLPPLLASIAAGSVFGSDLLVAASFLQLAALVASLLMIGEQPDWQASLAGAMYLVLSALGGMALLFGFVLADLQRLSPGGLVTIPFVV
ncbi:MAG TPA: hypothetical protein VGW38_23520, partial [Chloroflexota bacterium]|nr:hypothetical protein [Chloroflexota bacterium]